MSAFYKVAFGVLSVLMPVAFRIKKEGTENLPQGGGCLYVSNHRSNADPILIGLQNRKAQFCFLAKQELFSKGFVGWVLRKLGAVAVDRGTGDLSPLDELRGRLENGENALIFPEGTRSKDGSLGRFKTGAALIAAQSGVPVVPVGISFEGKLHFRSRITVRFGEPFQVPQTDPDNPAPAVLKQVRQEMTQRVSALLPAPPTALPMQKETSDQKGELES